MPQAKELRITPFGYSPPRRSVEAIQQEIEMYTSSRDLYVNAKARMEAFRNQLQDEVNSSNGSTTNRVPSASDSDVHQMVWMMNALGLGGNGITSIGHGLRDQCRIVMEVAEDRARRALDVATQCNLSLRAMHTELTNATKPKPEDVVLSREKLRNELKGIPQIPLRSLNLGTVDGIPTLTWRFDGVRCTPNELTPDRRIYGFNAGEVPSFALPSMLGALPLRNDGIIRFKPARGHSGVSAFSRNAVHPHHMSGRDMCLGDYKATIEELKFQHDFAGVILLMLDFMQRCELTDPAGGSYYNFINAEISRQLAPDASPSTPWGTRIGHPNTGDYSPSSRKKLHLWLNIVAFPKTDGYSTGDRLYGRLARLRGQWVFQPTAANDVDRNLFSRVWTLEETVALRDSLTNESHRAFFAKDIEEYQLLARMVTDNVPIQYNEATSLVLNTLDEAELTADDSDWDEGEAVIPEHDNDNDDEGDDNGYDDDEAEEAPEDTPYIDEPY